jgi:hypothetical protein
MSHAQSLRGATTLARIDRSELVSLLYGEITTPEQAATLSRIAEEAGVDVELLLPATGEPEHDPRTHTPAAPAREPEEPREPTAEELADLEDDVEALVREDLVVRHLSDVAEIADLTAEEAEATIRAWRIPPTADITRFLISYGRRSPVPEPADDYIAGGGPEWVEQDAADWAGGVWAAA